MSHILAIMMIFLSAVSCGKKSSSDDTAVTESADFTALKAIMVTKCGSCHGSSGAQSATWYSSETAFKANITELQLRTGNGTMPQIGSGLTLTTDEKAKFAAYK